MKHKKRGLALLLMLTLALLCGCEGTVSERPMEDISALTIEPGADAPTADTFADQTQTVTLYLLSPNGERLVPVPAEVTMRAGESLAQAALTALLAEPENLQTAFAAAQAGADRTCQSSKAGAGRASYLNSDSLLGNMDPGAHAVAMVFKALAER